MRNTRTAAACLAATTLLGLLSATPATAEPLDGGAGRVVQRDESTGSGLGLLGRSVTDVSAGQSDRGAAGMTAGQQLGGSAALPLLRTPRDVPNIPAPTPTAIAPALTGAPAEPAAAPVPAPTAQSSSVTATLTDMGAVVSLPEDLYRSDKRIVVIVEGKFVAQIQNQQTRGAISRATHTDGEPVAFLVPDVKPGDRMAVTEYTGTLDSGFDDSLRRERLFAGKLGEAAPAPAEPAPTTSPAPSAVPAPTPAPSAPATNPTLPESASSAGPVVSVTYNGKAIIDMPEVYYSGGETRVKVFVNGVVAAELWNGSNSGSVSNSFHVGDRFRFAVDADAGDQVKVVASDVDGSGAARVGSERVAFDGLMQPAGAPVVTASYENHRALIEMPRKFYEARVKVFVNGEVRAEIRNKAFSDSVLEPHYTEDRYIFAVDAAPGDQVKVVVSDTDGSGAARVGSERVLFDKKV